MFTNQANQIDPAKRSTCYIQVSTIDINCLRNLKFLLSFFLRGVFPVTLTALQDIGAPVCFTFRVKKQTV